MRLSSKDEVGLEMLVLVDFCSFCVIQMID